MLQINPALAADTTIYDAKTATLDNGMRVVVVENARTPAVTHMVWYMIGGGDEPAGQSGLAHYLEHLMFKGTETVESGAFSKLVKSWGGNDNAFTSWDYTAYFQTVPADRLEDVMRMEADRMRNLSFDPADALTERDVVVQERKERTESNPSSQLSESMRAALFVHHPYGRPIIGWGHELEVLDPAAAKDFYRTHYAPQNAILVVSGDVAAATVFEMAQTIYGGITAPEAATRPAWPAVPHLHGRSLVTLAHPNVNQPVWRRMYRAPAAAAAYDDFLALTLAEEILGGNTGLLYQALVMDRGLASALAFYYQGVSYGDATVSLNVTPLEGIGMDAIDKAVRDVLSAASKGEGITAEAISRAVGRVQDESVYERDSLTGPAMMLGVQLAVGMTLEQAERWVYDLERITPVDVARVIERYLTPVGGGYHAVTGHLLPDPLQKAGDTE